LRRRHQCRSGRRDPAPPRTHSRDTLALARSFLYGNLVRTGFSLAILGRPNAGKSSLFNASSGRTGRIVTDIPGTTRDLVSETANCRYSRPPGGYGRNSRDGETIEKLGIERSFQAMSDADLTIIVVDATQIQP